ncbi:MAG: hypothetical protein BMS9Abin02_0386 [Anaerolineae bacterium]|nr:MAG: hypothetical protein BMS9Abin02_0386 [Anaerolineae bacterium]
MCQLRRGLILFPNSIGILIALSGCVFQTYEGAPASTIEPTVQPIEPEPTPEPTISPIPLDRHPESGNGALSSTSLFTQLIDDYQVSMEYPAIIDVEIAGRGILGVERVVMKKGEGGHLLLLREALSPNHVGQSERGSWSEGIYEFKDVWTPEAFYLTNGTDGAFVTVQRPQEDEKIAIAAKFRESASGILRDVYLVYDGPGDRPSTVRDQESDRSIRLPLGSEIVVWNSYISPTMQLAQEPIINLTPDDEGRLVLEKRALPAGEYDIAYRAQTDYGVKWSEPVNIEISETAYSPDLAVWVFPEEGIQFKLPDGWAEPEVEGRRIWASDPLGQIEMSLTIHPDIGLNGPEELRSLALQYFGPVSVLYQDQTAAGGWGALRSVYAYDAEDGSHTGVFLTLVRDGVGYVLDLDSAGVDESDLQSLADTIMGGWRFRSSNVTGAHGKWIKVNSSDLLYYRPVDYIQENLENGWNRAVSRDGMSFLALRSDSTGQESLLSQMDRWLQVAAYKATDFKSSELYNYEIGGLNWHRLDFEYQGAEGQNAAGFLMGSSDDGGGLFVWAEAPNEAYEAVFNDVFRLMISSIERTTN